MLTADRVVGALVLLKAVDVALRGPGGPLWAPALAALVAGAAVLLLGRDGWSLVLAGAVAVAVDAPLELRRQHLVLLAGVALAAVVARDARERLLLWRVQLAVLYGVAALAKANETFLGGDVLALALRDGPLALRLPLPLLLGLGVLVVLVEAALALAPWRPGWRRAGTAAAAVLHTGALLLAADALVGLRVVFFGGLAVLLHAASAGLLPVPAGRVTRPREG